MHRLLVAVAVASLFLAGPAGADYERGCKAFDEGDFERAMKEWKPAAQAGDAKSQFRLGCLYTHGQGVEADPDAALRWYREAAEQGDADAQNNLGGHYAEGLGVEQDYVTAYMWFRLAVRGNHEVAMRNLEFVRGRMTEEQVGEAEDLARDWLESHPVPTD